MFDEDDALAPMEHGRFRCLELGAPVPDFDAASTHGRVRLYDYQREKWIILFSHPADFTPVCTTEFVAFERLSAELAKRNVALIGTAVDSVYSHIAWVRSMNELFDIDISFPILADVDMRVARAYHMIHDATAQTAPVRAVFFIDPDRRLRATITYPPSVGRNFKEILRVVDALQTADEHDVSCPADWEPGDDVVLPPPATVEEAKARMKQADSKLKDWYLAERSL